MKKSVVFAAATLKVLSESSTNWPVPTALAPAAVTKPPIVAAAVDAALLAIVMFSPDWLSSVIPVPALFTFAVTPVLEDTSLNALTAADRPSALTTAPTEKAMVTAVVLLDVTLTE